MSTHESLESRETKRPARWRTAVIAVVAIIVVVGAAIGITALFTNNGDTTLTFDGETLTYDGPETVQAGTTATIALENTSDEMVQIWLMRLRDEDMTLEEYQAARQAGEDVDVPVGEISPQGGVGPQSAVDAEYRPNIEGTYGFAARVGFTDEQGLTDWMVYNAETLIHVTGD